MGINKDKLRGKIVENRMNLEDFSRVIGMNPATFYRKLQGDGQNFTVGQMHKIVDVLHLSNEEAMAIFFW